jgi:hypothetical protein
LSSPLMESLKSTGADSLVTGRLPNSPPTGGQMRWELPPVKSVGERELCLAAIRRLDHCDVRWAHYGKPIIGIDSPTRYRMAYKSIPEKDLVGSLSLFTNIYFLVTHKGTVCGIWAGE